MPAIKMIQVKNKIIKIYVKLPEKYHKLLSIRNQFEEAFWISLL